MEAMDLIKFFIVTMYVVAFLGFLLVLYLRRVYSKDSKKN
jgi:hypothetical protein